MDMLTLWKIKRIFTAKRMGVDPTYLDTTGDAPDFGDIDVRRYETRDIISVMDAAIMAFNQHGVRVFPDWYLPQVKKK